MTKNKEEVLTAGRTKWLGGTVFRTRADLLLGLPGERGVVLQQRGQREVGGGQLPVDAVPHCLVALAASQQPHRPEVVVDGLQGATDAG